LVPRILNIFLSPVSSLFSPIAVTANVSLPHTTTGFSFVLYILILIALLVATDLNICHTV
jgi:hypothetical protein